MVLKHDEVTGFLVFTVPCCWNDTFGTVTVIRLMLIIVVTFNDIDNAIIMREKELVLEDLKFCGIKVFQDVNTESWWCSSFITSFLEVKIHQGCFFVCLFGVVFGLIWFGFFSFFPKKKFGNKTTWLYIQVVLLIHCCFSNLYCLCFYYSSFSKTNLLESQMCFWRCQMVHWPWSSWICSASWTTWILKTCIFLLAILSWSI